MKKIIAKLGLCLSLFTFTSCSLIPSFGGLPLDSSSPSEEDSSFKDDSSSQSESATCKLTFCSNGDFWNETKVLEVKKGDAFYDFPANPIAEKASFSYWSDCSTGNEFIPGTIIRRDYRLEPIFDYYPNAEYYDLFEVLTNFSDYLYSQSNRIYVTSSLYVNSVIRNNGDNFFLCDVDLNGFNFNVSLSAYSFIYFESYLALPYAYENDRLSKLSEAITNKYINAEIVCGLDGTLYGTINGVHEDYYLKVLQDDITIYVGDEAEIQVDTNLPSYYVDIGIDYGVVDVLGNTIIGKGSGKATIYVRCKEYPIYDTPIYISVLPHEYDGSYVDSTLEEVINQDPSLNDKIVHKIRGVIKGLGVDGSYSSATNSSSAAFILTDGINDLIIYRSSQFGTITYDGSSFSYNHVTPDYSIYQIGSTVELYVIRNDYYSLIECIGVIVSIEPPEENFAAPISVLENISSLNLYDTVMLHPSIDGKCNYNFSYSSSDISVVEINKSGLIYAKGIGTAIITVTNGYSSIDIPVGVHDECDYSIEMTSSNFNSTETNKTYQNDNITIYSSSASFSIRYCTMRSGAELIIRISNNKHIKDLNIVHRFGYARDYVISYALDGESWIDIPNQKGSYHFDEEQGISFIKIRTDGLCYIKALQINTY